jgi:hypothetical protein
MQQVVTDVEKSWASAKRCTCSLASGEFNGHQVVSDFDQVYVCAIYKAMSSVCKLRSEEKQEKNTSMCAATLLGPLLCVRPPLLSPRTKPSP